MVSRPWPIGSPTPEAEELEFRYRSLLAAQRILDSQIESARFNTGLRGERLRRLRLYVKNSIAAVERRMEELGLARAAGEMAKAPASEVGDWRNH